MSKALMERAVEDGYCIRCGNDGYFYRPTEKDEKGRPVWLSAKRTVCPCKKMGAIGEEDNPGEYIVDVTWHAHSTIMVVAKNEEAAEHIALRKAFEMDDPCDLEPYDANIREGPDG